MNEELEKLELVRKEIEFIDFEILKLFEDRMENVLKIAKLKKLNSMPILNLERENSLLKNVINNSNARFKDYNVRLFKYIFKISKKLQEEQ